jgi:predicted NBD/HSP70 family sugar kinase
MPGRNPSEKSERRETRLAAIVVAAVGRRTLVTRAELGKAFGGSSPASMTGLVQMLKAAGVLSQNEVRYEDKHPGYVRLADDLLTLGAAELHHDGADVVVATAGYQPLAGGTQRVPLEDIEDDPVNVIEQLADALSEKLSSPDVPDDVPVAIGLAVPSPVDVRKGQTASPLILRNWGELRPAKLLADRLSPRWKVTPVMHNDATLGALGIQVLQALQDARTSHSPLVYVRVTDGVGAGVVVNGRIVGGERGLAGELGHFKMDERGALCPQCGGVGCLETIVSNRAILDKVRRDGILSAEATIQDVIDDPHPACARALRDAGWQMGIALAHVCNLLNPALVVLGGEVSRSPFVESARRALERDALPEAMPLVQPAPERHGLSPELAGALAYAAQEALLPLVRDRIHAYLQKTG